ncbi:MAG TPA: GDSL-type esterase/lipase family protein [Chitinophagaceae bacterium]|nr:GDSL-type esterase/lipase family protein [Chitinophagaceae bacterium]HUM65063.1 GDSL-type esterase/lipase family protein [Chitinophagaceae bacterium]
MRKIIILLLSALIYSGLVAQDSKPAFWNDIQSFKQRDSAVAPPGNAILFIGSSSFTMWKDVQQDFPSFTIINRGFGGSTLLDQLRYVRDIVYPYHPKQIIVYCGENDLAASNQTTGEDVADRFKELFQQIRKKFPKVQVTYVSMKPSPSRQMLLPKMIRGNELIKKFLATKKRTGYIDVYKEMIDDEGKPRTDIFLDDNLHMNEKGYTIWRRMIAPHLMK